jgi:preprotein translocase subunit SecA
MIVNALKRVFGTKNDRELKRIHKIVNQVNEQTDAIAALSDEQLKGKTAEFKKMLADGKTLDDILPEAFACVREAATRSIGLRHYDVQLVGGIALHEGRIAEMRTGEGKTLVATLPAYLNSLPSGGVHVVTVNDYLARRDADWMRPVYEFLGLKVGVVLSDQSREEKRDAYLADITYGTNNEFGFDFLRDNMAFSKQGRFQKELNFAIVDEVDSILIDEARTPLIISGPVEDSSATYKKVNTIIPRLEQQEYAEKEQLAIPEGREGYIERADYVIDEKNRSVELTEHGHEKIELALQELGLLGEYDSLYSAVNLGLLHHVHAALKAHKIFQKNVDYIVQNKEIVIVDEHTGRTMPGRRWSEGIHQAVEAKESVPIQNESQTLASTTFQNYFRLYKKLSGMTGTADTEASEFQQIYSLGVLVIPTNKPMIRDDIEDLIYLNYNDKFQAIVTDVKDCVERQVPVLVGTVSIETSELLSNVLKKEGIKHQVLNAKFHKKEASIIAQAGRPGVVTIATNMAGRGTDIVLGGNWEAEVGQLENPSETEIARIKSEQAERQKQVLEAGGLQIIGTERHESRRIDNQLRGRSGRQGDPGATRFYLSLEDDLMRRFASDGMRKMMQNIGMEGEVIQHRWVTRAIENAQKKVEARNFDIRKSLLEYDDVANDQRLVIYTQRKEILEADDIKENIDSLRLDVAENFVWDFVPEGSIEEQWKIESLDEALRKDFNLNLSVADFIKQNPECTDYEICQEVFNALVAVQERKESQYSAQLMRSLEKQIMLEVLDRQWKEHLAHMDHLRQGIGLRSYASKNPKQEYKKEAFELFQGILENIKFEVIQLLAIVEVRDPKEVEEMQEQLEASAPKDVELQHDSVSAMQGDILGKEGLIKDDEGQVGEGSAEPFVRETAKVGRNEPCPCGSGKKYKQCHGKIA